MNRIWLAAAAGALVAVSGCTAESHVAKSAQSSPVSPASPVRSASATAPVRHQVVLPQAAPATAQWIVDILRQSEGAVDKCPGPDLSNMVVLDASRPDRADVVWLTDDVDVCVGTITRGSDEPSSTLSGAMADIAGRPPVLLSISEAKYGTDMFTVFFGAVGTVTIKGDTDHTFGPVHQRTVDLGGGRFATFVEYRFMVPYQGAPLGSDLELCPSIGPCRKLQN